MKIMDLKIHRLYQVNLTLFLYFTYCHLVASDPVKRNMLEAIAACDSVKFLRNSSYINECNALSYPVEWTKSETDIDLRTMCITLNHITNKVCEYHINNKSQIKAPENAEKFDEEVKKLEPKSETKKFIDGWCKNTTLFLNVSIQSDTNPYYIQYANKIFLNKTECANTCYTRHRVDSFCMVFLWFNKFYNVLQSSKIVNASQETAVPRQESLHKITADDILGKPVIIGDNINEHTSIVNPKPYKEESKTKIVDTGKEISNNLKAKSIEAEIEPDIKKNIDQLEAYDREQQNRDSKLPSSTDDNLNKIENKIENPKTEIQEGNDDFMDEERKKTIEDGIEGENDHDVMETNKKDSLNDSGNQHRFRKSRVIKEPEESYFIAYVSLIIIVCIGVCVGYHNKHKMLALVVEGRQSRKGRSSRRPNTANYRKLDSNLEEAVTSQCNSNVSHVIY